MPTKSEPMTSCTVPAETSSTWAVVAPGSWAARVAASASSPAAYRISVAV